MCHSPVEQKWNSTSAIIEQQGAEEVFVQERRNSWGGVGENIWRGEKVRKQLMKHWLAAKSIFLSVCFYSKRNRQGYTVNEMIHNIEEVNSRERNGMLNKCGHYKGIWTLSKKASLSTQDGTHYSSSFIVNNTKTLSFSKQKKTNWHVIKQNKCTGYVLIPDFFGKSLLQTVAKATWLKLFCVFVLSEVVLQTSFTFKFRKPTK